MVRLEAMAVQSGLGAIEAALHKNEIPRNTTKGLDPYFKYC